MATAADIPTPVTMEVAITEDTVVMVCTGAMDGMAATTVGTAEIGAIHTPVTDGVLVLVLALALALGGHIGDIGVGDTHIATPTALGITLPTLTTTRLIVLRYTHALPTGTMTLRLRIPALKAGATQQSLGDRR
jgi:phosphatidylglycerophosphate synthase